MRISIKDVAREAAVAPSTASKALNGTGSISSDTIKRVMDAADKLGYRPMRAARMLSKKDKTIGVLLATSPSEVMEHFERGIAEAASEYLEFGVTTRVIRYDRSEDGFISALKKLSDVDFAILMPPTGHHPSCEEELRRLHMPILSLQSAISDRSLSRLVSVNSRVVGKMAAQYLTLSAKRPKCAIICGELATELHMSNVEGFRAGIKNTQIKLESVLECLDSLELASKLTEELLESHPDLGGIFVTSYVAPAVCEVIRRRGVKGISVIGVDIYDKTASWLRDGTLGAVIYQNQILQAKAAMECAMGILGGQTTDGEKGDILIKPELVWSANLECYL